MQAVLNPLFSTGPRLTRTLMKYLSREILAGFLIGGATFLVVLLLFQAIRLTEFVVIQQVAMREILRLVKHLALSFLPVVIPLAYLFSVLLGISRANSEGEILALQVSGIRVRDLFLPILGFGALVGGFCLYVSLYTVPESNREFDQLVVRLGQEKVISGIRPGVFEEGFYGLTIFAEQTVPAKSQLKRVFIFDKREKNFPLSITAQAGILKVDKDKRLLTLRLSQGAIHTQSALDPMVQRKIEFDVYDINLDMGAAAGGGRNIAPPSYTFPLLKEKIASLVPTSPREAVQKRELEVELHRRFAMSFCCVVFAALGFFIGLLGQKGVRSGAIMLCLLVAVIYWIGYLGANALAIRGTAPPWLAVWMPNLVFLGVAYWAYRRSRPA